MTERYEAGSEGTGSAPGALRLSLMGGFRLEDQNGCPILLNLRKAEALLAYLAMSPGQSAARETLAALLWGGFEQPRARQSLRQVLLALGRTLNAGRPPVLRVSSQTVALTPGGQIGTSNKTDAPQVQITPNSDGLLVLLPKEHLDVVIQALVPAG